MENTIARTCPFCGHHEVELQKIRGPKDMPQQYHAICVMCQATAPFSDSEEGAIEEWNERACDRQPVAPETVGVKALASATGSAASSKEPERDESDCAPYWLCYAMAEYVCAINETCEREPVTCAQSSLCITEWCVPCAALAWLNEQKRLSAPLPPNVRMSDGGRETLK